MKKEYEEKKATLGPEQSLSFKESTITLDISREGKIIEGQWKVFPTIPPKENIIVQVAFK